MGLVDIKAYCGTGIHDTGAATLAGSEKLMLRLFFGKKKWKIGRSNQEFWECRSGMGGYVFDVIYLLGEFWIIF